MSITLKVIVPVGASVGLILQFQVAPEPAVVHCVPAGVVIGVVNEQRIFVAGAGGWR